MEEKEIQDELASIRSIMERSSKFISLSGLSGILAGVYALIGAAAAYQLKYTDLPEISPKRTREVIKGMFFSSDSYGYTFRFSISPLILIALLVLIASIITGVFLTKRKARQKNQSIWGNASRSLLFHMATPLITGGMLMIILITRGYYGIVAPLSLIFYGLALISASNFTFTDVKYLGICEILLGLVAACLPGYGLLFWAIGFGVLHIVYGSVMYFKYDR